MGENIKGSIMRKSLNSTYLEMVEKLMSIPKYGSGIGLHRFYTLTEMWDIDLSFFEHRVIHVTGSNGKGSVTAFSGNLLKGAGLTVGTFTSPHLLRFNERIQINNREILDCELVNLSTEAIRLKDIYEKKYIGDTVGAFELFTLIAAKYFFLNQPNVIVVEAGIGGRFDTTKCFGGHFAALVSLDYEHTALLGNTLEEIGYDKSDIIAHDSTLILGNIPDNIVKKMIGYNRSKGTTTVLFGKDFHIECSKNQDREKHLCVRFGDYRVEGCPSLLGTFQEENASVAIALSLSWLMENYTNKVSSYIRNAENALLSTKWSGRLETISSSPKITIDVGHSPGAVKCALNAYAELRDKSLPPEHLGILVTGVSGNKNIEEILQILAPHFSYIICTKAYHRGETPDVIATHAQKYNALATVVTMDTIEAAMDHSIKMAEQYGMAIYVAGGLFLSIEYSQAFRGNNPKELIFF
ncbi:MAG: hypothetical protein F6K16_39350 [Symploca sp. SIO2B6]|nr:hypothetical protein [Symploca sp. SIO2B6]